MGHAFCCPVGALPLVESSPCSGTKITRCHRSEHGQWTSHFRSSWVGWAGCTAEVSNARLVVGDLRPVLSHSTGAPLLGCTTSKVGHEAPESKWRQVQSIFGVTGKDVARRHVTRRGTKQDLGLSPPVRNLSLFSAEKVRRPMTKVTTSHGGQLEHQLQMCARVNGKSADHPVICSAVPVQVRERKRKCPDGTLHL